MTEVLFYHLQRQPLARVLPVLLEKCRERGWKVVVQAGSEERAAAIDDLLWTYSDASFLPHGTPKEGAPESQPILIATDDSNPNGAEVRVLLDGAAGPDLSPYARALILFEEADSDALAAARERWKALKATDHAITYWQQDDDGRWVKKA